MEIGWFLRFPSETLTVRESTDSVKFLILKLLSIGKRSANGVAGNC